MVSKFRAQAAAARGGATGFGGIVTQRSKGRAPLRRRILVAVVDRKLNALNQGLQYKEFHVKAVGLVEEDAVRVRVVVQECTGGVGREDDDTAAVTQATGVLERGLVTARRRPNMEGDKLNCRTGGDEAVRKHAETVDARGAAKFKAVRSSPGSSLEKFLRRDGHQPKGKMPFQRGSV